MRNLRLLLSCAILFLANLPAVGQSTGSYVVLTTVADTTDDWYQPVRVLRDFHSAEVITFSPSDPEGLLSILNFLQPRYAAIVLKPTELDINFNRRFVMMSTQLDDDPFSDFSYGYITGASATDALNFTNRILQAIAQNIQNFPLNVGGYAASSLNFVFTVPGDYMVYLNPPSYSSIYLETNDNGSGRNFFLANTAYMLNNKVLDIGYNGDPHMLWLFEGGNSNPNPPVWVYDSSKIENPAYARVGLTSTDIGSLNLYPAVAFNGACHAGETKRVMVESDIAATFGDTQGLIRFYTMSDGFSYALSILKTGITGYFAPCGANNANDQSEEVYNAFLYHEPLGDIQKRTIDGTVMGFLGNPINLRIFEEFASSWESDILPSGTFNPDDWPMAASMLGGKANRIYFGDPLFNPYANDHSDSLEITKTTLDSISPNITDIHLHFKKTDTYFPVWDKFHFGDTRIYAPVVLPSYIAGVSGFEVLSQSGPSHMVIHAVEYFDGKTILHIEVDIPDDMFGPIDYSMVFRINTVNTGMREAGYGMRDGKGGLHLSVSPNPAKEGAVVHFTGSEDGSVCSLQVIDRSGRSYYSRQGIRDHSCRIPTIGWPSGIYFIRVSDETGRTACGKLAVMH